MKKLAFDKKTTSVLKGIALFLMFEHHLFGFPEWLTGTNSFISIPFDSATTAYYFGKFGNICVAMFMFITGYGTYFSFKKGGCVRSSLKKIVVFLLKFWIMFFTFFLPIECFFGKNNFTFFGIIKEMFGLSVSIVSFAWYVRFYILAMLTLPFLRKILDRNVEAGLLLTVIYSNLCVALRLVAQKVDFGMFYTPLEEYFRFMPLVFFGYMTARFKFLERADEKLSAVKLANVPFSIFLCAIVVILRVKVFKETYLYFPSTDIILCPVFIYALIKIVNGIKAKPILKFLEFIGVNSMNLWFLQSIFYGATAQKLQWIAYLPKISILTLIWSVMCCLPVSMLYNRIFKLVFKKR